MLTMQEIKNHYYFSDTDAEMLKELFPLAQTNSEAMVEEFYTYLLKIPETAVFLRDPKDLARLKRTHTEWFLSLFCGRYDNEYMLTLQSIGQAHVRIKVSAHYVNAAMNVVRRFLIEMLQANFPDISVRRKYRIAVEKILDINLDIMSTSYQEEELRKVFVSHKIESKLIHAAERFTYGLNLILVIALSGVSLSVVTLFFWDLVHIFRGDFEKGILSALGSLLILWMMIELMDNEIKTLKGGKFNILIFIGVIIVALIREILISTLRHDALETQAFLAGTLLILGIVYYLVAKSQVNGAH
ncbi:phosphate-starvation-inducible PsiE family protein [Geomonas sp. Red69]|uniref:Phosphate-starvation-inducible PsiE family protein n=1 Tax=Geomonas diazotrophica TaxID=2843197 RepID=A0ABX8JFM1_9BACT|nr:MULTISPECIES: protoglobin domain-containing protein [Geomonas]MBU5638551.1 phosphate-starvation-inducible PsiE family protein [Geomonas diazotrophica]QWV97175.1 phosphate-starvation-inducible PsiE family protein [Geomonas nitrogeniifigens]QXE86347.1 phosphate-starvation-inducible PsiE family protein [Geomonas nitrogeniifigens]